LTDPQCSLPLFSGFSYASLEVSGHAEDITCPNGLLAKALAIFQPGKVSMALSVDQADQVDETLRTLKEMMPGGYNRVSAISQRLDCGGAVSFYNLEREGKDGGVMTPRSPGSFHHASSCLSVGTMSAGEMTDGEDQRQSSEDLDM
jgi:hypothetical protein